MVGQSEEENSINGESEMRLLSLSMVLIRDVLEGVGLGNAVVNDIGAVVYGVSPVLPDGVGGVGEDADGTEMSGRLGDELVVSF